MGQRKVVLRIEAILDQRIDVVDIELSLLEHEVNRFVADEAPAALPGQQTLFERGALLEVEAG